MSLFHYTDASAVTSILQNRKLWLTDIRYLNDRMEFLHGVEILKSISSPNPGLFSDPRHTQEAIQTVLNEVKGMTGWEREQNPTYVCSLSKAGNLLSQWRGYGLYAVEFNEEALLEEIPCIKQCIYDPKKQYALAYKALTDAVVAVSRCIDENNCLGVGGFDALAKLWELAATFKDSGFEEEQEFRVLAQGIDESEVKYRAKNNMLIPYVEVGISLDCVKAVHVGPMNERELALQSMRAFARQREKDWHADGGSIEYELRVEASLIPFRSI